MFHITCIFYANIFSNLPIIIKTLFQTVTKCLIFCKSIFQNKVRFTFLVNLYGPTNFATSRKKGHIGRNLNRPYTGKNE